MHDEFFSQTLLPSDFFKKDMDCFKILQGGYNPLSSFKIESGELSEYRSRYLWKNFNSFLDDQQQQKFIPEYFELNNDAREGDDRLEYFICKHEYRRLSNDDILKKIKEEGIKSFCKYSNVDALQEVLLCSMWEKMSEEEKSEHDPEKFEGGKKAVFQKKLFYKETNENNKIQKKNILAKIDDLIEEHGVVNMGKLKRTANNNVLIAYWLDLAWSIEEKRVADIEEEISSSI